MGCWSRIISGYDKCLTKVCGRKGRACCCIPIRIFSLILSIFLILEGILLWNVAVVVQVAAAGTKSFEGAVAGAVEDSGVRWGDNGWNVVFFLDSKLVSASNAAMFTMGVSLMITGILGCISFIKSNVWLCRFLNLFLLIAIISGLFCCGLMAGWLHDGFALLRHGSKGLWFAFAIVWAAQILIMFWALCIFASYLAICLAGGDGFGLKSAKNISKSETEETENETQEDPTAPLTPTHPDV